MEWILLLSVLSLTLALPSQVSDAPPRPNCIKMSPEIERQIDQIVEKLGRYLNNLTIEHEHFDIRLLKLSIEQHTEDEEEKETVLQLAVNDCQLSDDDIEEIDHRRAKAKLEREKAEKETARKENETELKKEQESDNSEKEDRNLKKEHENDDNSVTRKKQDQISSEEIEQENNKNSPATETNTEQDQESVKKPEAHEKTHDNSKNNGIDTKKVNQVYAKAKAKDQDDDKKNKDNLENNGKEQAELNNNDKEVRPEVMYLDLDDNGQKIVEVMDRKKKFPIIVYVQKRNSGQSEYWFLKRR